jgi:hypothetical protein
MEPSSVLIDALRQARAKRKWDSMELHATATFRCELERGCPVTLVKIGIHEQVGRKPFQGPNLCPRCRTPLQFIQLDVGR